MRYSVDSMKETGMFSLYYNRAIIDNIDSTNSKNELENRTNVLSFYIPCSAVLIFIVRNVTQKVNRKTIGSIIL